MPRLHAGAELSRPVAEALALAASVVLERTAADAVMKFAAQGGYGLVLCEEVRSDGASPWVFAADTVIELGVDERARDRWIEVRKNRFGLGGVRAHLR